MLTLHLAYWKYAVRRLLAGGGRGGFPRAVAAVPPGRLGRRPAPSRRWTYGDLVTGIALHDAYHTGQLQLMKRLYRERRSLGR